jgi:hypothetical protein
MVWLHYSTCVGYRLGAGSSSPNSKVASLLPVRTIDDSQYGALNKQGRHALIGSFGWKSTAVTVPLWPGSCDIRLSAT